MKNPKDSFKDEIILRPFVVACGTDFDSVCDLLFIHGSDLAWTNTEFGLYLFEISVDDSFDETMQITRSDAELELKHLLMKFTNPFQGLLSKVILDSEDLTEENISETLPLRLASQFKENPDFEKILIPQLVGNLNLFTQVLSNFFCGSAISIHQRQVASTGLSTQDYQHILYCAKRLELCEPVVRITFPLEGFSPEISFSGGKKFEATFVSENSQNIEIFRLIDPLAQLKSKGNENALAVFIAHYVNQKIGSIESFACARYGEKNDGEFDAVIPKLNIGFEVKLFQTPFAQTESHTENIASNLRTQITQYKEVGCKTVYIVSNLSSELADSVFKKIEKSIPKEIEVIFISNGVANGKYELIQILNDLIFELEEKRASDLTRKFQAILTKQQNKQK